MNSRKRSMVATSRPSPLASIGMIVVGVLLLIFGLSAVPDMGGGFVGIWALCLVGLIAYNIFNLVTFPRQTGPLPPTAAEVIEVVQMDADASPRTDFDTLLRKLDALRRDGLITEEEYQRKRKEILDEKW